MVHNKEYGCVDLWIHGSAAGAAGRAAAGAPAGAAASAATVCTYYVIIVRAPLCLHDEVRTVAAEAAAPAADPWIHGSISFTMNQIFYYEMKNTLGHIKSTHLRT